MTNCMQVLDCFDKVSLLTHIGIQLDEQNLYFENFYCGK
jgi:hypothetical protein